MPKNSAISISKGQGRRPQSGVDMFYQELTAPENRSVVYSIAMFTVSHAVFLACLGRGRLNLLWYGECKAERAARRREVLGNTTRIPRSAVRVASEPMMYKRSRWSMITNVAFK